MTTLVWLARMSFTLLVICRALRQYYCQRVPTHRDSYFAKRAPKLCQNCVTYPPKPRANTVIYGDTLKQIVVAGSR